MKKEITSNQPIAVKGRKQVNKKLSTGQKISLSLQDERILRAVYDYLAGFQSRRSIEASIDAKRSDVNQLHTALPPSARLSLQVQPKNGLISTYQTYIPVQQTNPEREEIPRTDTDSMVDQYIKAKEELQKLEEKLKAHGAADRKISYKDLDAILKSLGATFHRKQIEVCICNHCRIFSSLKFYFAVF
jgi:hypothetical protein